VYIGLRIGHTLADHTLRGEAKAIIVGINIALIAGVYYLYAQ
jgi:hypothetical protein